MLTDEQISELRSRFPILREKTYLYSCSQGALCDAVEAGMQKYAASWRTSMAPWNEWMESCDALRSAFAHFINAQPEEVAIITSSSAGINPIANALQFDGRNFDGRNKVVLSEYEFPTMGQIWLAQRPRGAEVHFLDGVNNAVPTECYERAVDTRTRIVPLSHVSFVNGFRPDVTAIAKIAHSQGALLFLDGYQDCGSRPLDVKAMDVDFFVTGTLKYLLGPPGLGFLYVRRELIETLTPTMTSWMAQRDAFAFNPKCLDPSPDARRFEGGSPPIPNIYMARPAIDLLTGIGMENVAAQIERLTGAFLKGVRDLRIDSKTPSSSVGPLVVLHAKDAAAMLSKLNERGIAASMRRDGVRFAFHVYNNLEDVNVALTALEDNLDLMVRL
jgi:selenocysteine lyase/cysteine desulfurase